MNIVYLGCSGFPFGFAEVQKQMMISKALKHAGNDLTVLCNRGVHNRVFTNRILWSGVHEQIKYYYTSFNPYRNENFFLRNLFRLVGKIAEFVALPILRSYRNKNIAIVSTLSIYSAMYYYFICKLFGYKVVLSYEELNRTINLKGGILQRKFDNIVINFCDAMMPISEFLFQYQRKINTVVAMHKIPVLTDFDLFDDVFIEKGDKILFCGSVFIEKDDKILFCGSAGYYNNINFVLSSFELLKKNVNVKLLLIIHGSEEQKEKIRTRVSGSFRAKDVVIESNLSYSDLIRSYKSAQLLLIPLEDTVKDRARFPHKISEYTASGTPIITTAVGEINNYFSNNVNAFVAEKSEPEAFANKIDFALSNPELMKSVAKSAYTLGRANFHYKSISNSLNSFLLSVK